MPDKQRLETLKAYSANALGTRALEQLSFVDYADLIVAFTAADLPFPKPPNSPPMERRRKAARAILHRGRDRLMSFFAARLH